MKLNNFSTFHVEQIIDVPRGTPQYRTFRTFSRRPDLFACFLASRLFSHFSPVYSLFGGSAARVGRRIAEQRVAPHNRPDPIVTCRRNAEKRCCRNVLPPKRFTVVSTRRRNAEKRCCRNVQTKRRKTLLSKRFAAETLYRRFDTSPKRRTAET